MTQFLNRKLKGKIEYKRDPHLPSAEICDWLRSLEWSGIVPVATTTFPEGGPFGMAGHEAYDHVYARAGLGANEVFAIELPAEALQLLEEDAQARAAVKLMEGDT